MAFKTMLNLRIGAKLAVMQAVGVLLVLGLVANALYGSSTVDTANKTAASQQSLALDMSEARSAIRIMAIRVRDIRLAQENVEIQEAVKGLELQQTSASKLILTNIPKVRIAENRERLQKAAALL